MIKSLQLRSIKIAAFLSEETTAFSANIYIDGKLGGHASNDGHGGNTMVHLKNPDDVPRVAEYARKNLNATFREYLRPDASDYSLAEDIVDQLLEEHLAAKEAAKTAKIEAKNIAILRKSCPVVIRVSFQGLITWGGVRTATQAGVDAVRDGLAKKYSKKHGPVIDCRIVDGEISDPRPAAELPAITGEARVSFKNEGESGGVPFGPVKVIDPEPYEAWCKVHGTATGRPGAYAIPYGAKPDGLHDLGWLPKPRALEIAAHYRVTLQES